MRNSCTTSAAISYSRLPGMHAFMARTCALAAMRAASRMVSTSARLLNRRMSCVTRLGAQAVHPADHALVELRVRAHGVEHLGAILEQAGQDFVDVAYG